MTPYFQTHPVGVLYLFVVLIWYGAEIVEFFRQQQWREDATRVGPRSFWPVVTAGPYRVLRHPGYAGGLLATLDDRYRAYAAHRKRLVPLIW
jgi:protein-S-isoprenylcysteine O-methyltransferase Ste14